MTFKSIIYNLRNEIAFITLNRPKALNALNQELLMELNEVVDDIAQRSTVKVVIISGSGEKAFAAGADIKELKDLRAEQAEKQSAFGNHVFSKLSALPQPVIAAVNGFALGGGMELALACDLRFASHQAKFGLPEVGLGIMPGYGGTQRLGRLIGWGRAKQFILATETIGADEAYRLGIVNKVVEHSELMAEAETFAEKIISKSYMGVQMAKETMDIGSDLNLEDALALEASNFGKLFSQDHQKEGMTAFLEKRPANFS